MLWILLKEKRKGERMEKRQRQKCEIWARVVGYLRPIDKWNEGKLAEFEDRTIFSSKL